MQAAVWCWLLLAAAPPQSGLWEYSLAARTSRFLGPFSQATLDPEQRLLYAVNAAGQIVRLNVEDPAAKAELWIKPAADDAPMSWPLAAPKGGLVAVFRDFALRGGATRVCVDIWTRDGQRLRGPLPLVAQRGPYNGTHLADWHPDGEVIAFPVAEGQPRPGLYVFRPANRNWVLAEAFGPGFSGPWPQPRFQPNGRSLSHVTGDQLILRAGADWGSFLQIPVRGRLHEWLSDELLAVLEAGVGLSVYDIGGGTQPRRPGPTDPLAGSLPSILGPNQAMVRPKAGSPRELELVVSVAGGPELGVASFPSGAKPYGLAAGAPLWHPEGRAVYYTVP